jgi:CysZ protein
MLRAITRSLNQLFDPRIRGVLVKSLLGTLVLFALLWGAVWYLLTQLVLPHAWLHWVVDVLGGLAVLALSWVLFPGIAGLVVSLFLDTVADAVEARHYPGLGPARRQSFGELVLEGLRFAGVSILLNLLALPVYLFVPAINLLVFLGLNGYLLSREYFELVAFRRLAPPEARRLRLAHPAQMLLMGALIAFLLTIPVANLIAPVFATALMVHAYHGVAAARGPGLDNGARPRSGQSDSKPTDSKPWGAGSKDGGERP